MELKIFKSFKLEEEIIRHIARLKLGLEETGNLNDVTVRIYKCARRHAGRFGQYFIISYDRKTAAPQRCFLKIPPALNSNEESIVRNLGLFNREAGLYSNVFDKILKPEDGDIIPKFYFTQTNKILVTDEMEMKNYVRLGKLLPLNYDHCCAALKTLATFHARSLIYEEKVSGHSLLDDCESNWNVHLQLRPYDSLMQKYYSGIGHSLAECFRFIPQLIPLELKKFTREFQKAVNTLFPTVTARDFSNMRVLCHSDAQVSNLMFSYKHDGKPDKCCLFDFQFVK